MRVALDALTDRQFCEFECITVVTKDGLFQEFLFWESSVPRGKPDVKHLEIVVGSLVGIEDLRQRVKCARQRQQGKDE